MPPNNNASISRQWLVQGADVASDLFSSVVADDPDVVPVRRIADDVVVLMMSDSRAASLKQQFGGRIIIEKDETLTPP
jgi:hypothetical protein